MTQRIEQRIEPFFNMIQRFELFFNMIQIIEPYFDWLTELKFFSWIWRTELNPLFSNLSRIELFSKNWTLYFWLDSKYWTFRFNYGSMNWTLSKYDSKNCIFQKKKKRLEEFSQKKKNS